MIPSALRAFAALRIAQFPFTATQWRRLLQKADNLPFRPSRAGRALGLPPLQEDSQTDGRGIGSLFRPVAEPPKEPNLSDQLSVAGTSSDQRTTAGSLSRPPLLRLSAIPRLTLLSRTMFECRSGRAGRMPCISCQSTLTD